MEIYRIVCFDADGVLVKSDRFAADSDARAFELGYALARRFARFEVWQDERLIATGANPEAGAGSSAKGVEP